MRIGRTVTMLSLTVFVLAASLGSSHAWAEESSDPTVHVLAHRLKEQQKRVRDALYKLERQRKEMKAEERLLKQQQHEIESLRALVLNVSRRPATAARGSTFHYVNYQYPANPGTTGSFDGIASAPSPDYQVAQAPPPGGPQAPVGQAPPPPARPQLAAPSMASEGGVLTPPGVFSFEPTIQYQYASNNQFLVEGLTVVPGITIGSESVRSVVDRMTTMTLGGRLGLTNRFEVEAEVPFVYRSDSTTLSGYCSGSPAMCYTGSQTDASGYGLGDIQFGGHYQLNSGAGGWPYFIANLLVKSDTGQSPFDVPINIDTGLPTVEPTGTGFWAIEPSVTAIYPSDPVVFFLNLRDIYQIPADVTLQPSKPAFIAEPTTVHLAPGDGIGATFGMGLAINDKASFSLAYEHTLFLQSTENGAPIPGSTYDIGDFDLGFAYRLNRRINVNLGIQIGATKAAPDAAVVLRIPIKFHVF